MRNCIYFKLLINGRTVFMGYLNQEAKSKESFDEKYNCYSCDLVSIDEEGFLTIKSRCIGNFTMEVC